MNPTPLVYVPVALTPTKPTDTPIIDKMMHDTTTVKNKAEEEVSQRIPEVKKEPRYRVEEEGSQGEHGMAEADHMSKVQVDKSEDEGGVYELEKPKYNANEREYEPQ